jgi:hypothetical protein
MALNPKLPCHPEQREGRPSFWERPSHAHLEKAPAENRGSVDHRRKISLTVLSLHRNGIPVLPPFGGTRLPERLLAPPLLSERHKPRTLLQGLRRFDPPNREIDAGYGRVTAGQNIVVIGEANFAVLCSSHTKNSTNLHIGRNRIGPWKTNMFYRG